MEVKVNYSATKHDSEFETDNAGNVIVNCGGSQFRITAKSGILTITKQDGAEGHLTILPGYSNEIRIQ